MNCGMCTLRSKCFQMTRNWSRDILTKNVRGLISEYIETIYTLPNLVPGTMHAVIHCRHNSEILIFAVSSPRSLCQFCFSLESTGLIILSASLHYSSSPISYFSKLFVPVNQQYHFTSERPMGSTGGESYSFIQPATCCEPVYLSAELLLPSPVSDEKNCVSWVREFYV